MGTVAALFLRFPVGSVTAPWSFPPLPDSNVIQPLAGLPFAALLAVLGLVVALFCGLAAVAWMTCPQSLLPGTLRGRAMWVLLTGGLGLAAWFFAATVTFGATFPPRLQFFLGYAGGGLPFALVAAALQRSWQVILAASVLSLMLIIAGTLLVAMRTPDTASVFTLYFRYLGYLRVHD